MKSIDIETIKTEIEAKNVHLVDVREADEFIAGHVPGAINIPLSLLSHRYYELDSDKPYHIICQMGGRSAQACMFLESKGYDVTNINGGTCSWSGELEK